MNCDGPLTEWGLPYGNFDKGIPITGNGSSTSIDIYLDTAFAAASEAASKDYRFDWDSDLLDNQGNFLQDYIFNVAVGDGHDSCAPSSGGYFVIEASTNSQRSGANAHNPGNLPQTCITQSGWYTFTHTFTKDQDGNLEVDLTVSPAQSNHAAGSLDDSSIVPGSAARRWCMSRRIDGEHAAAVFGGRFEFPRMVPRPGDQQSRDRQRSPQRPVGSSLDDEQAPFAGYALEAMRAAITELETGACDQVLDRAGDEYLIRVGERCDAGADMHRDADHVVASSSHSPVCNPVRT